MRALTSILASVALTTAASPDAAGASELASHETRSWYRESLAAAYAVPVGGGVLVASGVAADAPAVAFGGLVPLALGGIVPPIVHWAHGNVGRGFLSMGGQSLGFTLGVTVALAASDCSASSDTSLLSDCFLSCWGIGGAAGTALWAVLDVGLLAYEDEPAREESRVRLRPILAPLRSGAVIGMAVEMR